MNNLYRKVAVASVGIALGFALGANKEAKAATFILSDPEVFFLDGYTDGSAYSLSGGGADILGPKFFSVQRTYDDEERRAFYEFDVSNLSLAPDTVIIRATLNTPIREFDASYRRFYLRLFGYVGNGSPDLSDFNVGVDLGAEDAYDSTYDPERPRDQVNFDVTGFVTERVNNRDDFAGFGIRVDNIFLSDLNYGTATLRRYYSPPSLIIETADATVPEPTTIFGSAIGLCLGGWLKRKRSNQQKKTIAQH